MIFVTILCIYSYMSAGFLSIISCALHEPKYDKKCLYYGYMCIMLTVSQTQILFYKTLSIFA